MKKQTLGIICLILWLLTFVISVCLNYEKFNIPYLNGLFTPVAVNVEISKQYQNSIKINGENFSEPANQAKDVVISKVLNGKIKKLELTTNNVESFKNISSIDIFIGRKFYHFSKSDLKVSNNRIDLPIKTNYKGNFNAIIISFLALFYNLRFFVITWIFAITGFFLLEYKIRIHEKWLLWSILILAILCRFNQLTAYPLWWDEVFVINLPASHIYPLNSIFLDPANPSFFYLLVKIYTFFAKTTIEYMRLIPFVFGTFGVVGVYFLAKKFSTTQASLLATFIASISIYHICYSQELRGYSLILLIAPFVVMTFFDLLKDFNKKNSLKFILTSSIMINTHLFGLFLLLTNFLYAMLLFIKSGEKPSKYFKFTLCNAIIFLTLVPYLLLNFIQTLTGRVGFNSHILPTSAEVVLDCLSANFGNILLLIIFITLCVIYLKQYKEDTVENAFVKYGFFTIFTFWTIAIFVSLTRPLLTPYYFIVLYPLYLATFAIIVCNIFKNSKHIITRLALALIALFMIHSQTYNNHWKTDNSFENIVSLVNARAKDNPTEKYYLQISPKRIRDYYTFEKNMITDNTEEYKAKHHYFLINSATRIPQDLKNIEGKVFITSFTDNTHFIYGIDR